jgi:hypothetical protein
METRPPLSLSMKKLGQGAAHPPRSLLVWLVPSKVIVLFFGSVQCLMPYFLPASLLFLFAKRTVTVLPLTCSDHCSFKHSIFFYSKEEKKESSSPAIRPESP